ncbi:GPI mannosyltransferase 4 isoform X2 [Contarinia nasturtii]|uniref:GPI mannosyltransferase 4 isoform X2 n=1 Tax=Contarinia nasturtii TaxID=265458 RepID=UPI0012D4B13D|nr:GPI mannosyltransferase 4 isoform X2 [Contarinia nasturtii]
MKLSKYLHSLAVNINRGEGKYFNTYIFLAVLRVCLVFLPQSGYIHPDEFFQSVEIPTGEEFKLEHTRTWEFNNTMPIRSMALPLVIYRLTLNVYGFLAMYVQFLTGWQICTPYAIFVVPRLIMCLISFVSDWSLYKICTTYALRYDVRLLALASSVVSIVFSTRTFSNNIEMALCSLLLYVVADCMMHTNSVIFQRKFLDEKYNACKTIVEKVKVHKLRYILPSYRVNKCYIVSTICVIGCFNRPTFLFFGLPIVFFWMYRGMDAKTISFVDFHLRFFSLLACEIQYMEVDINNFVVTPLNFIRYNIDPVNTAAHGVHPKYLHVLVNIPLLYNILGVIAVCSFGHLLYRFSRNEYLHLPRAQSIVSLMNAAIFVPVALLSLVNHQEPRFLLPITLPIIILHAPKLITGFCITNPFSETNRLGEFVYRHFLCTKASANRLLKCWYAGNTILAIFFGIIHQGGVIQLTEYFQQNQMTTFQQHSTSSNVFLVTSHLYNIPTSYLFQPSTETILINPENGQKYTRKKQFFLYEYGGLPMDELQQKIKLLLDFNELRLHNNQQNYKLYLAIPSSLTEELSIALFKSNYTMIKYQRIKSFYPHLSTEALPNFFRHHQTEIRTDVFNVEQKCSFYENYEEISPYSTSGILRKFSAIIHQFGLVLYRVEVRHRNTFSQ